MTLPDVPRLPEALRRPDPPRRPSPRSLLLSALLVLALGAATGLTAPHWPGVAADTPAASAATADGTPALAPEPPVGLRIEVLAPAGEIDADARARVTWTHPGPGGEEHVRLRWHELPENYAAHAAALAVHGRSSAVLTVPPGLEQVCVEARTLDRQGTASSPELACLPPEGT